MTNGPGGRPHRDHRREEKFLRAVMQPDETHATGFALMPATTGLPALMAELGHIIAASAPSANLASTLQQIIKRDTRPTISGKWRRRPGSATDARAPNSSSDRSTLAALSEGQPPLRKNSIIWFAQSSSSRPTSRILKLPPGAISLLGQASYATAGPALQTLLDPRPAFRIQTGCDSAIAQSGDLSAELSSFNPTLECYARRCATSFSPR